MYSTVKAVMRQGRVELLEPLLLPDDTTLLVTVLDDLSDDEPSLGEMIIAGLTDIKEGRFRETSATYTVKDHLDYLFGPESASE